MPDNREKEIECNTWKISKRKKGLDITIRDNDFIDFKELTFYFNTEEEINIFIEEIIKKKKEVWE